MKYLLVVACLFSNFTHGMIRVAVSNNTVPGMPAEIAGFKRSTRWVDMCQDEHEREYWELSMPHRVSYLSDLNINDRKDLTKNTRYKETSPLFDVADNDQLLSITIQLMSDGANPNFPCATGHTPFELALRKNAVRIAWHMANLNANLALGLRVLMDHTCRTSSENLFKAQQKIFECITERMRSKKISVDRDDALGRTALMNIMQVKRDINGRINVPLEYRKAFITALVANGADPDKKDEFGFSARDRAERNNLRELIPLLCKK